MFSTADRGDFYPGDGICATFLRQCTLRAAIQEGNTHPGPDTISIPVGAFMLTAGAPWTVIVRPSAEPLGRPR